MKAGRIGRLKDAQAFLQEEFGITYESESGISRLFRRRGVKPNRAGRPRHRDADPEAQTAFKK
jgi:transposase